MELYKGLGFVALIIVWCIFLWGVAGWWRYWRAVQAAAEARRLYGAQNETLWRMLRTQAEWDAQRRRDEWTGRVLDEVLQGMEGQKE